MAGGKNGLPPIRLHEFDMLDDIISDVEQFQRQLFDEEPEALAENRTAS